MSLTLITERPVLSVEETGELLGLSRNSMYSAIARGEIPSIRVGRRLLIPKAALLRLLLEAGNSTPME